MEVKLIPKTLKGLSVNKELRERGEGGEGGERGGGGDWERGELLEPGTIPIRISIRICISIARFRFEFMKIID